MSWSSISQELQQPLSLVGVEQSANGVAEADLLLEISDGLLRIGAVADRRVDVVAVRPRLERLDVARTAPQEPARGREVLGVAVDGRERPARPVREVAEVALPAAVVVAEEEQALAAIQDDPAHAMDRR